jgi:hypothetical protein
MLHHSHREDRSVADRDQPTLARRVQRLAESGDYEGFNAIVGSLARERDFDLTAIDVIKRDTEFRNRITDVCHDAYDRKHPRR